MCDKSKCPGVAMDFIGTSINYDDNSEGVNFKDDYWITKYDLFNCQLRDINSQNQIEKLYYTLILQY